MQISITRKQLEQLNACQNGLDWFDNVATNGAWSVDWTPESQVEWVKDRGLHRWLGWAAEMKLLPIWAMSGANLSWANLRWADLYGADLNGANLSRANLIGAKWNKHTIWPDGFTPEA